MRKLSGQDASFLYMETPTVHMHTVGTTILDPSTSPKHFDMAHDDLPDEPLVCTVPVSVKSESEKEEFSNKIANLTVRLPIQQSDPKKVIASVRQETKDAKRMLGAVGANLLQDWMQYTFPALFSLSMRLYPSSAISERMAPISNLVVSNMPGPPIPLYVAGARVDAVYPMGPLLPGAGLNITVLSNMGRMDIGVIACRETVPDIWQIADGFGRAVQELKKAAGKRTTRRPADRTPSRARPK